MAKFGLFNFFGPGNPFSFEIVMLSLTKNVSAQNQWQSLGDTNYLRLGTSLIQLGNRVTIPKRLTLFLS